MKKEVQVLRDTIDAMKAYDEILLEYCTGKCAHCPLGKMCNWDRIIDHGDPAITDEVLTAYYEYGKGQN